MIYIKLILSIQHLNIENMHSLTHRLFHMYF